MNHYYHDFAAMSESRWNVERDIDWRAIEPPLVKKHTRHLELLRQATLIESYHPISTRAVIGLFIDDIDATSVLTVELFEGFRHFWALRRFLAACDVFIDDEELVKLRRQAVAYSDEERLGVLLNFAWSEHFAGYFFRRIGEETDEPVLKRLMKFCMQDEFRHCAGALKVLGSYAEADAQNRAIVLRAMREFRHYGNDIGPVPVSLENDLEAVGRIVHQTLKAVGATWSEYAAAATSPGEAS
jgi:hypothetical protein